MSLVSRIATVAVYFNVCGLLAFASSPPDLTLLNSRQRRLGP